MLQRFPNYMSVLEQAYRQRRPRMPGSGHREPGVQHQPCGGRVLHGQILAPAGSRQSAAIANHHNALAIFSDESSRNSALKNLLAILKMAEHICASYRVLGNQPEDHEWNSIGHLVLDYVGLSDYDFETLKQTIRDLGTHR